jgi:hypothetical protein
MINSLAAVAIFGVLGASVIALPWVVAPKVEASEPVALAAADRLADQSAPQDCSKQVWPNIATACLRSSRSVAKIVEARPVTGGR